MTAMRDEVSLRCTCSNGPLPWLSFIRPIYNALAAA